MTRLQPTRGTTAARPRRREAFERIAHRLGAIAEAETLEALSDLCDAPQRAHPENCRQMGILIALGIAEAGERSPVINITPRGTIVWAGILCILE